MLHWIVRKWDDLICAMTIVLSGRKHHASYPLLRGRVLIKDVITDYQAAKMPHGYKLVAMIGLIAVPKNDPIMVNGQLSDVVGSISHTDEPFPYVSYSIVASHNIQIQVAGKQPGELFDLPIWDF